MTIKELKERIADLPDDLEIWMSTDEEGNSYNPLFGLAETRFKIDTDYPRESHPVDAADEDYYREDYEDDEEFEEFWSSLVKVALLWP